MYLIIFEDGIINKVSKVTLDKRGEIKLTQDEIDAVDAGVCDLIDISNSENPTAYCDGKWIPLESVDQD